MAGTRWIRFSAVGALGVVLQLSIVSLLANRWHADYRAATLVGVLAALVHNFAWHRRWTWRDRPERLGTLKTFLVFAGGNGVVSLAGNLLVMRALVGSLHVPVLASNIVAITVCSVANYLVADKAVFRQAERASRSGAEIEAPNPL